MDCTDSRGWVAPAAAARAARMGQKLGNVVDGITLDGGMEPYAWAAATTYSSGTPVIYKGNWYQSASSGNTCYVQSANFTISTLQGTN